MATTKGFTIIELLITIAIASILLTLSYLGFNYFNEKYNLINAANQLYSDIQWIRQKSLGSVHLYGIKITSNGYILFEDTDDEEDYDVSDKVIKVENFKGLSLSGCNVVVFTRRGEPDSFCTISISNLYGKTKNISISQFKVRIK